MKEEEIKQGIQLICDTSKRCPDLDDKNALIEKLNSLDKEDLSPLKAS